MTLVFQDNFTEATTDTVITSHTPDTGTAWIEQFNDTGGGVINVLTADSAAVPDISAPNDEMVYLTDPAPTEADVTVQCVYFDFSSGGDDPFGVVARHQDDSNYLACGPIIRFQNPDLFLVECIAGTRTAIASYDAGINNGDGLKLTLVGTNATVATDTGSGFVDLSTETVTDDVVAGAGIFWGAVLHVTIHDVEANKKMASFQLDEFAGAGGLTVDEIISHFEKRRVNPIRLM